jgi:DnaA-like protein
VTRFLSDWGIRPSTKGAVHERKRHPSLSLAYVNLGLSHLLKGGVEIDLELIHKRVASTLRIRPATLKSRVRTEHVMAARQIAMYLCRKLTDSAFPAGWRILRSRPFDSNFQLSANSTSRRQRQCFRQVAREDGATKSLSMLSVET